MAAFWNEMVAFYDSKSRLNQELGGYSGPEMADVTHIVQNY
jgi:hypothetical protein